jgi:hypothetical protein
LQLGRLQARLQDVSYDDAQQDTVDTGAISKRVALKTKLVQAFGSSRRYSALRVSTNWEFQNGSCHVECIHVLECLGRCPREQSSVTGCDNGGKVLGCVQPM